MANSKWSVVSDRRQALVDDMIADMEKGEIPWEKPWIFTPHVNAATGKAYRGMNCLTLGYTADKQGFPDPRWCTFKQAQDNGWSIKAGSKATNIEFWEWYHKTPALDENGKQKVDENGKKVFELEERDRPICVSHAVFNASQIDGIPAYEKAAPNLWESIETAENILKSSGAVIENKQSNRAYYSPMEDKIVLPLKEQFKSQEGYYGTALHELGHWTGHSSRLNRGFSLVEFGSSDYAKEELRAELASAFLNSELGIKKEFNDSAAYLQSWIKVLRNDKDELYRAAHDADKIANYIMEFAKEKELSQEKQSSLDVQPEAAPAEESVPVNKTSDIKETAAGVSEYKTAPCDVRLYVSLFESKEVMEELGAKNYRSENWPKKTIWYAPKGEELDKFAAYLPKDGKLHAAKDTPITVNFNEREAAKERGARWDSENKSWYIPQGEEITKFEKKYFMPAPEKVKIVTKTFEDFAQERGLIIDKPLIADGKIHRVPVEDGKPGGLDGAYKLYDDQHGRAGYIKNYRTGEEATFGEGGKGYSKTSENAETPAEAAARKEKEAAIIRESQDKAAVVAAYDVTYKFKAAATRSTQPYLTKKGVEPHGTLLDGNNNLIVPLQNIDGKIRSYQTIYKEGGKQFMPGGQISGCFYPIGLANKTPKDIIISEGFATGASIHEATGKPVLCAMHAGNLKNVALAVREKYGDKVNIVIAGDNDHKLENNPGKTKAEEAAAAVKGTAVIPTFTAKEKEAGLKDFNDLATRTDKGKTAVKEQISPALSKTKSAEREIGA